jgi:hypothetical protein
MEREALERVSRAKAENTTALDSTDEDAEGFTQNQEMSEREHRAQFEELTLLQTRGSELCHAIMSHLVFRPKLNAHSMCV